MRSILLLWAFILGAVAGFVSGRARNANNVLYRIDTLRVTEQRLDTLYKTQRVRYDSIVMQWDTARVTDTIMRNDTVFVRRDVADSVVSACRVLVTTCESRVANLKRQMAVSDSMLFEITRYKTLMPWVAASAVVLGALIAR